MQTAALYIRVSTDDQAEYSPDAQKRLLSEYASKHNLLVPEKFIFIDDGVSGKKAAKRPQFQHMIGLAKSKDHPFDVILVWKYSRFARNQEESIVYKSLLKRNRVEVVSISEPMIDGPFGTLIERIIEWMDEYYSIRLSEEVTRGMTEKAMRGEYQAGAPFGYEMRDGRLCIREDHAITVGNIYDMYLNQSMSFFAIARHLNALGLCTARGNKFEGRTVKYILQNPVYKGWVRWRPGIKASRQSQTTPGIAPIHELPILKEGSHEPIISETLWEKVNDKLKKESRPRYAKPETAGTHWLSGMLFCNNCNGVMVSGGSSGGFQCNNYSKGKCSVSHYVKYDKIEEAVLHLLEQLPENSSCQYELTPVNIPLSRELQQAGFKKLEQKEERIRSSYLNGIDTLEEYRKNKARLKEERREWENKICCQEGSSSAAPLLNTLPGRALWVSSVLTSNAEVQKKNAALKSIVRKIVYDKERETIDLYLFHS